MGVDKCAELVEELSIRVEETLVDANRRRNRLATDLLCEKALRGARILERIEDAGACRDDSHIEHSFEPVTQLFVFEELLKCPAAREYPVAEGDTLQRPLLPNETGGYNEELSGERPGVASNIDSLPRFLDDVEDIAEIDDIRLDLVLIGKERRIPAACGDAELA